jgi:hypothetical protein
MRLFCCETHHRTQRLLLAQRIALQIQNLVFYLSDYQQEAAAAAAAA